MEEGYRLSNEEFQAFLKMEFLKLSEDDFISIKELYAEGEFDKVISLIDDCKTGNRLLKEMMVYRGLCNFDKKNYEQAIKDFDEEISLNPDSLHAYNNRGLAKIELAKYDEALKDFNKAIDFDPLNFNFYANRGRVYLDIKNYKKCIIEYLVAYSLFQENKQTHEFLHNIAFCYLHLKVFELSKKYCELTLKLKPDSKRTLDILNFLNNQIK